MPIRSKNSDIYGTSAFAERRAFYFPGCRVGRLVSPGRSGQGQGVFWEGCGDYRDDRWAHRDNSDAEHSITDGGGSLARSTEPAGTAGRTREGIAGDCASVGEERCDFPAERS